MKKILGVIIADVDGTLISGGNIQNCPIELKQSINYARKTGWWDKIVRKLGEEE